MNLLAGKDLFILAILVLLFVMGVTYSDPRFSTPEWTGSTVGEEI